jgi:hypothetical protein
VINNTYQAIVSNVYLANLPKFCIPIKDPDTQNPNCSHNQICFGNDLLSFMSVLQRGISSIFFHMCYHLKKWRKGVPMGPASLLRILGKILNQVAGSLSLIAVLTRKNYPATAGLELEADIAAKEDAQNLEYFTADVPGDTNVRVVICARKSAERHNLQLAPVALFGNFQMVKITRSSTEKTICFFLNKATAIKYILSNFGAQGYGM